MLNVTDSGLDCIWHCVVHNLRVGMLKYLYSNQHFEDSTVFIQGIDLLLVSAVLCSSIQENDTGVGIKATSQCQNRGKKINFKKQTNK